MNDNDPDLKAFLAGVPPDEREAVEQRLARADSFWKWFGHRLKLSGGAVFLAVFTQSPRILTMVEIEWIQRATGLTSEKATAIGLYSLQAVLCFVLPFLPVRVIRGKDEAEHQVTSRAVTRFTQKWHWVWFAWAALYLAFSVFAVCRLDEVKGASLPNRLLFAGVSDTLNNATTVFLLLAYFELAYRTVADSGQDAPRPPNPMVALMGVAVVLEITLCFIALASNSEPVGAITIAVSGLVSGLTAGLALALLLGRLDSLFFGQHTTIQAALAFYPVIQPLFILFGDPTYKTIFTSAALALKILLYLYVSWLLETGLLMYYMRSARKQLYDKARIRERREFLSAQNSA